MHFQKPNKPGCFGVGVFVATPFPGHILRADPMIGARDAVPHSAPNPEPGPVMNSESAFPRLAGGFAAALAVVTLAPAASAVVIGGQTDRDLLAPPAAAFGTWGANAAAVAIGPNHVITTRHQDGSGPNPALRGLVFNGTAYNSVSQTFLEPAGQTWDVRVVEIERTDGSPANLDTFLPIWDAATGGSVVGDRATLVGYGVGGVNGDSQGFDWTTPFNNGYPLRVGENVIEGTTLQNDGEFDNTPLFTLDFDNNGSILGESTVGPGDSGGGLLIFRYDQWWLVGLPNAVDTPPSLSDPDAFFGQNFTAVNLTGVVGDIESASGITFPSPTSIPEPASAALIALGGLAVLRRRR